jgi:hypothetical protein
MEIKGIGWLAVPGRWHSYLLPTTSSFLLYTCTFTHVYTMSNKCERRLIIYCRLFFNLLADHPAYVPNCIIRPSSNTIPRAAYTPAREFRIEGADRDRSGDPEQASVWIDPS